MIEQRHRIVIAVGVFVAVSSFLAGYLPQRARRAAAEAQADMLRARVAGAEFSVRVGQLLGRELMLRDLVMRSEYTRAQSLSSAFFDAVRAESQAAAEPEGRESLVAMLGQRDTVTRMLATADAGVSDVLASIEHQLRVILGHEVAQAPQGIPASGVAPPTG
jgi:hypothetical protein